MSIFARRVGTAALAACALLAVVPAAHAQRRLMFLPRGGPNMFAPTPLVNQQNALRQWAFNTAVIGQAYQNVPPYLLGYNPYPSPVNYGPLYQPLGAYTSPLMGGGYGAAPYGGGYTGGYPGGYGGGLGNPYVAPAAGGYTAGGYPNATYGSGAGAGSGGYSAGYNPTSNPYGYNPGSEGGYLYGASSVMNAYGQLTMNQEQARIMREQAEQAKLDTKKKRFDLLAYIRDNTPTFTQEQAKIAKQTLQRIQTLATPTEIWSGKALNVLLKDLVKWANKKSPVPTASLDEDVLKHLNIATKYGNLGILREDGKFTWPGAILSLLLQEERMAIEKATERLFKQAAGNAQFDANSYTDLLAEMDKLRTKLTQNVNNTPTPLYMDAKRFLNDFNEALTAMKDGDAVAYIDFRTKFTGGGKTVEELVDYMARKGLKFAPSSPGDEGSYQAIQSAMAAWSVALDSQQVASNQKEKE